MTTLLFRISFIVISLINGCISIAQSFWTDYDRKAYLEMISLRLDNANNYIEKGISIHGNRKSTLYLKNYISAIKVFLSDDQSSFKDYKSNSEKIIEKFDELPGDNPYKSFIIAETKLRLAFLKLRFGEEVSAAIDLRSAFKILDDNKARFPTFLPHLKSIGVLHVLIGSIPNSYKWMTNVAGMKGTVSGGIQEIKQSIHQNNEFREESELFLYLINIFILKKGKENIQALEQYYKCHPDNLSVCLMLGQTLISSRASEKALVVLQNRPNSREYLEVPIAEKLLADCYLYAFEYEKSAKYYELFLKQYHGQNYLKDVNFKLFLLKWFSTGKRDLLFKEKVDREGKNVLEVDKHAFKFMQNIDDQNLELLKIRILYDGGYFQKALAELEKMDPAKFVKKLDLQEYYYRKARLNSERNFQNEAILNYRKAIDLHDKETNSYMAPNACLQLGYIYLERYDRENAVKYFKKAIDEYSGHEYETSIENKAKVGLSEVQQ